MINREDMIEQSVQEYLKRQLFDVRGYSEDKVELLDAYPYQREVGLDRNLVAVGFNFDNQGEQAELGSDLMRRTYTIEFWIFGIDAVWGRNLANTIKFALDADGTIPLLDISQQSNPEIDKLIVEGVSAERAPLANPEPWQQHAWTTTLRVVDEYFALLA